MFLTFPPIVRNDSIGSRLSIGLLLNDRDRRRNSRGTRFTRERPARLSASETWSYEKTFKEDRFEYGNDAVRKSASFWIREKLLRNRDDFPRGSQTVLWRVTGLGHKETGKVLNFQTSGDNFPRFEYLSWCRSTIIGETFPSPFVSKLGSYFPRSDFSPAFHRSIGRRDWLSEIPREKRATPRLTARKCGFVRHDSINREHSNIFLVVLEWKYRKKLRTYRTDQFPRTADLFPRGKDRYIHRMDSKFTIGSRSRD